MKERFEEIFRQAGVAFKEVKVYGQQVTVECYSKKAANLVSFLLAETKLYRIKGIVEDKVVYNDALRKYQARNRPVHRVYATTRITF
jgi:hypothetical protein